MTMDDAAPPHAGGGARNSSNSSNGGGGSTSSSTVRNNNNNPPPPPPPPPPPAGQTSTTNNNNNNNNGGGTTTAMNENGNPTASGGSSGTTGNDSHGGGGGRQHPTNQREQYGPHPQNKHQSPPSGTLQLWSEVAEGLSKHQTVVWTKAVDSLEFARSNLPSPQARTFIDKYMMQIISILLEQQPMKIGQMEKDCVEKSVRCSLQIVKEDLECRVKEDRLLREANPHCILEPCRALDTLGHVFNKKKVYYKSQRQWSNSPMGLPEVRSHMITVFRRIRGFKALVQYLELRAGDSTEGNFPAMELCKDLLAAVCESLPSGSGSSSSSNNNSGGSGGNTNNNGSSSNNNNANSSQQGETGGGDNSTPAASVDQPQPSQSSKYIAMQNEARALAAVIMKHILLLDEITLKKMDPDIIKQIRIQLFKLYTRLSDADGTDGGSTESSASSLSSFFSFWRSLASKLITSSSLPLKLLGWDNIMEIITESAKLAPPPKAYMVSNAGTPFINGRYDFDTKRILENGYARPNCELQYHRCIPPPSSSSSSDGGNGNGGTGADGKPVVVEGVGKTLTLFRCTMRSQHKWWFLSEADIDQPGTDKDIDYYQHKSKREEESLPSSSGWLTCRAGADPPPTLVPIGKLVPRGEERNTLEHQLAKWAIENEVIELVLGDGIHREVVSRSVKLIQFLAGMCDRDDDDDDDEVSTETTDAMTDDNQPISSSSKNKYCLKASHLLLAWRTCTNKADAAVSAQVYQLLVSILPSLSPSLAIPLIEAIRDSLEAPMSQGQQMSSKHHQPGIQSSSSGNLSGEGGSSAANRSDHFFEVSEFCCAIAEKMLADNNNNNANNNSGNNNQGTTNNSNNTNQQSKNTTTNKVRESILSLQWAVLSHPHALTLKSYESIKRYVAAEIRKQDSTTGLLRMKFLIHCREEIAKNNVATKGIRATTTGGGGSSSLHGGGGGAEGMTMAGGMAVDETHALHMVQLSKFLLEGFVDRNEMEKLVAYNPAEEPEVQHFPTLLFHDLISYMKRRRGVGGGSGFGSGGGYGSGGVSSANAPMMRKPSSAGTGITPEFNHANALSTRLQILRFVYGLTTPPPTTAAPVDQSSSSHTKLSTTQLTQLWKLFSQTPHDRESLMTFLSNASKVDTGIPSLRAENSMHSIHRLEVGFVDNVYIFTNLFCCDDDDDNTNGGSGDSMWEHLGEVAYTSFQEFDAKEARDSERTTDALWKICLSAGNDVVAKRAMSDLLAVYNNNNNNGSSAATAEGGEGVMVGDPPWPANDVILDAAAAEEEKKQQQQQQEAAATTTTATKNRDHQFTQRIFNCLVQVKEGLQRGDKSSERSAERCIRILSTAIEQCHSMGGSAGAVAERLTGLFQKLQHGGGGGGGGEIMATTATATTTVSPSSLVEEYLNLVPHGMRGMYSCGTVTIIARRVSSSASTRGSPSNNNANNNNNNNNNNNQSGGSSGGSARGDNNNNNASSSAPQQPERFQLQIHPLQTLSSIKRDIALHCSHDETMIKLNNLSGRGGRAYGNTTTSSSGGIRAGGNHMLGGGGRANLNTLPDNTTLANDLGIVEGSEIIALLSDKVQTPIVPVAVAGLVQNSGGNATTTSSSGVIVGPKEQQQSSPTTATASPSKTASAASSSSSSSLDLTGLFSRSGVGPDGSSDLFFDTLISVLESLPVVDVINDKTSFKKGSSGGGGSGSGGGSDTHSLVWDLLLAMPTNAGIIASVHNAAASSSCPSASLASEEDMMIVEEPIVGGGSSGSSSGSGSTTSWSSLLDIHHFERSVYVMQILDSFLRPATNMFSILPSPPPPSPTSSSPSNDANDNDNEPTTTTNHQEQQTLSTSMTQLSKNFRKSFISSGGFEAVVRLFIESGKKSCKKFWRRNRMGNECALRIIKECFFLPGGGGGKIIMTSSTTNGKKKKKLVLSKEGLDMITFLSSTSSSTTSSSSSSSRLSSSRGSSSCADFLLSLVSLAIYEDCGVSDNAILRILTLVRMMLETSSSSSSAGSGSSRSSSSSSSSHPPATITTSFTSLPDNAAETFLTSLLLWKGTTTSTTSSTTSSSSSFITTKVKSAMNIRKSTEEMILAIPLLRSMALPWLVKSLKSIDPTTEGSEEFFSVLLKLVVGSSSTSSSGGGGGGLEKRRSRGDATATTTSMASHHHQNNKKQQQQQHLRELGNAVCIKLASYPRSPNDENDNGGENDAYVDYHSTGVLCGCLKLLIALIEVDNNNNNDGSGSSSGGFLVEGSRHVMQSLNVVPWSSSLSSSSTSSGGNLDANDTATINLMGSIFDGFISSYAANQSSGGLPSIICCDRDSRHLAFNVISAAAQACSGGVGYDILSQKINGIIGHVAPALRHRWGQNASPVDDNNAGSSSSSRGNSSYSNSSSSSAVVKYSGLKNQGCTCYMNSVLQQLFMMKPLRKNLCSAEIPTQIRSSGGGGGGIGVGTIMKGAALVGKKISIHWENGNKYDAMVDGYEEVTGMHLINYCPVQLATPGHHGGSHHHQGQGGNQQGQQQQQQQQPPRDVSTLPRDLPEEFILNEGRPGKETGAFEIIISATANNNSSGTGATLVAAAAAAGAEESSGSKSPQQEEAAASSSLAEMKESPDEASSRKLLEEVQRTFVNLDEGSRGRCFDPRSLVEASHCLKLEFDVWQQNDASEFAMKLLDRLEISLKKWSPVHFEYLAHTFGMKQTKQKICKECGLKTNREENLMNIDCQIRNKSSIHEALAGMCEDEIMEGDNKVLCDRCKVKTNTVLRTAISSLPDMLVLSLKRFDLDYTTFETVKLNSRCEFGEALNMKHYTLEAKEILEAAGGGGGGGSEEKSETGSMMDVEESETNDGPSSANDEDEDPLSVLPDDDYEYRLAGVLVHAGVAQGGHYYSFIKDRTSTKWYRFDDEDVTPFDPSSIEHECFGGKVKKETKFPNGHTHTVEQEQFANALMLFYEKVKPAKFDSAEEEKKKEHTVADAAAMEEDPKMAVASSNLELSNGYDIFLPEVRKSNSTHSWQSFLLTDEFQAFVKEILDVCTGKKNPKDDDSMDITPASSPSPVIPPGTEIDPWRLGVIRMSLSFVFDVLFHLSLKQSALDDWSKTLMQLFSSSSEITAMFVADLAKRTHQVYENWVRAYSIECPEEGSRRTALEIFARAISSLLSSRPAEQALLQNWAQSWRSQVADRERLIMNKRQSVGAMPIKLEAPSARQLEDIAAIGVTASSVGIILSFLTELIEVSPRYTQANIELCFFIRELANAKISTEGKLLRNAMVEAQFVARLSCLAIREKSHEIIRRVFPGSSVSLEIVEAISRNETHSSNILQMGMNNSGVNGGGNNHASIAMLLEAIGSLLGMPWVKLEPISYETGEVNRGRAIRALTPRAIEALSAVFEESKPPSSNGMTLRDIHHYLKRCGQHVPPQRIDQIFARHAVDEPDGTKLLNLKGFLAYYRDAVHSNEYQVQQELHAFGFRPNLTRRHHDARWYRSDERNGPHIPYTLRESIAIDVLMNHSALSRIHFFTELGLQALFFLNLASQSSKGMAEYLLAASACRKDTRRLLFEALDYLHNHIGSWSGGSSNEGFPLIIMIFSILSAIPDEQQEERINTLMTNNDREERRIGLLAMGDRLIREYPNNYQARTHAERYLECIHMIHKQRAISNWMSRNRSYCAWMEPETRPESAHPLQSRSDHSGRRGGGHQHLPAHLQNHDPNAVDDSDIEDDDSRSDEDEFVRDMVVEGSGVEAINGVYVRAGTVDSVPKYALSTRYNGRDEDFSLFRCKLTDNTRRWYISIVPPGSHPGTTKDIDFYAAAPSQHGIDDHLPPKDNWMSIPNSGGANPAPKVYPRSMYDDGDENQGPTNIVVDPDQTGYL